MAAPKGASSSTNLTNIPACWIYGIVCLRQVVQRKTGRNFYNIGPFAGGSSSQEVRNDRTGEQDVRTMQGWRSAPQGRATRRAPATDPRMGGRRGAPPTPPLPVQELPGSFGVRQQGRRARRRAGTSPRHLLGLGSGRSSSMDAQDKRSHGE